MSWLMSLRTAGQLALSAIQLFARMLYVLSTPLRWPLYYIYTSIVFLLSPIWVMFSLGLRAVSFATNLMARLKYFYVYVGHFTVVNIMKCYSSWLLCCVQ
ncbi:hypothetical protein SAMD00023353_0901130 [Rosellinia necatrix]|uniref:Uncharacterized protein n=1 Tax=Rosellinia necatrix TaxID=77044 RepID=A0A1W2THM4_ROSNE|nr:hypothetical protein SAMD00023353_0901130 [Rosellinia necatrix]